MVETIPKLFKTRNNTKRLVCAPSNSVADYLLKKIVSKESKTVVVIVGDPMQLGLVIYSKQADKLGLGKSYLERLFESEYYNSMNENYVTKLVTNYRCHHKILYLPSMLFYNEELIASKDYDRSCEESGGSIPSLFNRIDASKVIEIIQELLGGGKLTKKDIGLIAPFQLQVLKIQEALQRLHLSGITFGSVE
ncbi:hypothetical protein ACFE04_002961 [Oxalis oulophora]